MAAKLSSNIIKQELLRRAENAKKASEAPKFTLESYCFDKQLAFIHDPAKFKVAVCSRRAGKTVACAADLYNTALNQIGDVAYITLNRGTAKAIIWRDLLKLDKIYKTNAHIDRQELTITFDNGNMIVVTGAKDDSEIEKFRGRKFRKIYIDEGQSFRSYIKEFVDDVLVPSLMDYNGSLVLIGTPGPVPAGYFYEISSPASTWAKYKWTIHDNPWILKQSGLTPAAQIATIATSRGVSVDDPSIRREYFGEWIKDTNSLVFQFNPSLNIYSNMPAGNWQYIFGIDIGYMDSDAIAVLAYDFTQNSVYLIEEVITAKQDITSLADQIKLLQLKYEPIKMVMDAGALGKKIQEELLVRHQLVLEAAAKERKHEFIALMNGDLRSGRFKAFEGSKFAEDCNLVTWDWDDPVKPRISDKYHSDITDAALYGYRAAMHYIPKTEQVRLSRYSVEWLEAEEARMAEELELKAQGHLLDWGVDQDELDSLFPDDDNTGDMGF